MDDQYYSQDGWTIGSPTQTWAATITPPPDWEKIISSAANRIGTAIEHIGNCILDAFSDRGVE